jgi:hypothetical protein
MASSSIILECRGEVRGTRDEENIRVASRLRYLLNNRVKPKIEKDVFQRRGRKGAKDAEYYWFYML